MRFPRGHIVVFTALTLVVAAAFAHGQDRPAVRIGMIYTNVGPLAQLGIDMRDGFLLYWDLVGNRAGGRKIEVVSEGIATNKVDEGVTKARKLVERDRVQLLGGIIETPVAYALRAYVIEKKTPLVIMNAGADGLTQKQRSEYIFRSSFSNSSASHPMGDWAYKQGYRKMVLVASDFAGALEHIGGIPRTFTAAGGQIVQEIYPPLGTSDFAPYLAQIKRDADVVAVAIFGADALRFVTQWAEYGLKGKMALIGKGGLTDEGFLDRQGDAALGTVAAFAWSPVLDNPENKRFREAWQSKHNRPVTLNAESAYVGAQMIAKALEGAKGDVENVETFFAAMRGVEVDAPRGRVKLDAFNNPVHTVYMLRTERKGGTLQNVPVASYPNTGQFWTWSPEEFMALPGYLDMKGKWVK
jgi:branched-chain amino acid transport system substrate-binding protein